MTTFAINQGPFQQGFKPKSFFSNRKRMMELSAMQNSGGLKYSNDFESKKIHKTKTKNKFKPTEMSFFEILPWTLFVGLLFYNIVM